MPCKHIRFGIFVDTGFSMLALSQMLGALQGANRVQAADSYSWTVVSTVAGVVASEEGPAIATECISTLVPRSRSAEGLTYALLSGGPAANGARRAILKSIRETVLHGGKIIAVGAASVFLADAGLLAGRRCAVHWKDYGTLVEKYPDVMVTRNFYEIDGPYHTSAGELAIVDLMLRLVEDDCGLGVAEEVTQLLLPSGSRSLGQRQSHPNAARLERRGSVLRQIVEDMEENIAEPVALNALIKASPLSRRQIERHFEKQTGMSPKKYYLLLRLQRARELLRHSTIPIVEVAVATGFISHSHFSRAYKLQFGESPLLTRKTATSARNAVLPLVLERAQKSNLLALRDGASKLRSALAG